MLGMVCVGGELGMVLGMLYGWFANDLTVC